MNPPPSKSEANSTNNKNGAASQVAAPPASATTVEKTKVKPVTIQLNDELHRKLRIVALSKGQTASALVEGYVEVALRRDLAVALAKLTGE